VRLKFGRDVNRGKKRWTRYGTLEGCNFDPEFLMPNMKKAIGGPL